MLGEHRELCVHTCRKGGIGRPPGILKSTPERWRKGERERVCFCLALRFTLRKGVLELGQPSTGSAQQQPDEKGAAEEQGAEEDEAEAAP